MNTDCKNQRDTKTNPYKGYVFNERSNSLAGPFDSDITAIALRENSSDLIAVNKDLEILKTDLLELNDPSFNKIDPYPIDVTCSITDKEKGFIGTDSGEFLYRGKHLATPFSELKEGGAAVEKPLYFKDCYLSIAETNWMHFGSEAAEKEVYRVDLSFHTNSIGHLWLYAQNDQGKVSGQYKGAIKETVKVFTNLRGRRFKLKMFVSTHEDYPWAMREMAVGYNIGKSF